MYLLELIPVDKIISKERDEKPTYALIDSQSVKTLVRLTDTELTEQKTKRQKQRIVHYYGRRQPVMYDFKNLTFREIIDEELEETLRLYSCEVFVPKKKIFLVEGDRLRLLYFIRSGAVSLYTVDINGAEKTLYRLTRGWFFGEIVTSLGLKQTSLNFVANEDTTLYGINEHCTAQLMENNEKFRISLLKCTCYKTIALRYEIANFTFCSTKTRLLKSLFRDVDTSERIDNQWYGMAKKRTHYELGVDIGATRVTVSRLLSELCCEGRLRIVNNQIQFSCGLYEIMNTEKTDLESFVKMKDPILGP